MTYTEGHPPEHVLAELAEGVLEESEAARTHAHTRSCDSCQATLERLSEVSRMLRAVPAELHLPEHVSARIGAALAGAAEARARSEEPSPEQVASVTSLDDRPVGWFRRRLPRALVAAAAAAVVGMVGYAAFFADEAPVPIAGGGDDAAEDQENGGDVAAPEDQQATVESAPRSANEQLDVDDGAEAADEATEQEVLVESALDVWRQRGEVEPGCGEALAEDPEFELVGSTEIGAEVLVVLSDGDQLLGWTMASCSAVPTSGAPVVEAPVPAE